MKSKKYFFFFLVGFFASFFSFGQTSPNKNDSLLIVKLKAEAVYNDDFVQNTFYTWTTESQINYLRANKKLLIQSRSEAKGYSLFDTALRDSSYKNDTLVEILLEEQFSKKRFAWTNSWATVMGWENETYGNHLVKIVLNDSAIVGSFRRGEKKPLLFYDMKGKELTTEYVLKNKNRIAAIYHIGKHEGKRTERKFAGTYRDPKVVFQYADIPFREFVIINEEMIKNWNYGTDDVKNKIASEIALLKLFLKSKISGQKAYDRKYWISIDEISKEKLSDSELFEAGLEFLFYSNKCFDNDFYLLDKKRISAIIKKLQLILTQQLLPITK